MNRGATAATATRAVLLAVLLLTPLLAGSIDFIDAQDRKTKSSDELRLKMPNHFATGDTLLAILIDAGNANLTAPAGWTAMDLPAEAGIPGEVEVHIWSRVASADEPRWLTWTSSTPQTWGGSIQAFSGVDVPPAAAVAAQVGRGSTMEAPAVKATGNEAVLRVYAAAGITKIDVNDAAQCDKRDANAWSRHGCDDQTGGFTVTTKDLRPGTKKDEDAVTMEIGFENTNYTGVRGATLREASSHVAISIALAPRVSSTIDITEDPVDASGTPLPAAAWGWQGDPGETVQSNYLEITRSVRGAEVTVLVDFAPTDMGRAFLARSDPSEYIPISDETKFAVACATTADLAATPSQLEFAFTAAPDGVMTCTLPATDNRLYITYQLDLPSPLMDDVYQSRFTVTVG